MRDPFNRGCYDWDNQNTELLRWYKRLGEIRKGCKAFISGEFNIVYSSHNTIAYTRNCDENSVLVAVNNSDVPADIYVGSEWNNSYNFFDEKCVNGTIHLEPYRYALLSR